MNNYEYERKFLLKKLPDDFNEYEVSEIQQWYIFSGNPHIRIRKYDDSRCYVDIKWDGYITRRKIGFKSDFSEIEDLIVGKPTIKKTRYKKRENGYLIIIDFFESGLKLIEIESKNLELIENLSIPDWFGNEVTGDIRYFNHWMASDSF